MIGLVWGALQALFGIVAAVAAIPAIVEFMHFLFTKIGRATSGTRLGDAQGAVGTPFAGLFTRAMDLGPRSVARSWAGSLITVLLLVIELLTGLAESGVALEFTAAGLLRVLKATGKLSLDAIKDECGSASVGECVGGQAARAGHQTRVPARGRGCAGLVPGARGFRRSSR